MKKKILFSILFILIVISIILFLLYIKNRNYQDSFNIPRYVSSVDMDNDGIDDETDILEGAKEYLNTNPIYKSEYYDTGYPTGIYGVCTDVVGYALKNAGYDLRELVYQDIWNNRDIYNIKVVDKNIDFRRVNNLKIYFDRYAISLTLDINDISNWQGGDIVIFSKHIGIVSDKRNSKGIPYVLHLAGFQTSYEEDILESRTDIVGHYRIS